MNFELSAKPRIRVISDNDFAGDPDGLVQLAHLLLTPSVDVRGVIGSHLRKDVPWPVPDAPASAAAELARQIVELCRLEQPVTVVAGAENGLVSDDEPAQSPGANLIVKEAMEGDQTLPLFVLCGGSLTSIASAFLIEPQIAEKLTVVWIGGHGYDAAEPAEPEFNLSADIFAAQVVFNHSNLKLWQVPESTYGRTLVARSEVINRMANTSELGSFIWTKYLEIDRVVEDMGFTLGEALVFGDSPLVSLPVLQNVFTGLPSSSESELRAAPQITNQGHYAFEAIGREIRVFTSVDTRLMVEDYFNKLELLGVTQ